MKRMVVAVLAAITLMMGIGTVARAEGTSSNWKQGATIGSITFWGKTERQNYGTLALGVAYEYPCIWNGQA